MGQLPHRVFFGGGDAEVTESLFPHNYKNVKGMGATYLIEKQLAQ